MWARALTRHAAPVATRTLLSSNWCTHTADALDFLRIPLPSQIVALGAPRQASREYTRAVNAQLRLTATAWYNQAIAGRDGVGGVWRLLYASVAGDGLARLPAAPWWQVSAWTRLRCGMQWLGSRAGTTTAAVCPFCGESDNLQHALLQCPLLCDHGVQLPDCLVGRAPAVIIAALLSPVPSGGIQPWQGMRYVAAIWSLRRNLPGAYAAHP